MKMKLNIERKYIIILLALLIITVPLVYYYLVYTNKTITYTDLSSKYDDLKNEVDKVKRKIATEPILDTEIASISGKIDEYSGRYYSNIYQEEEIKNINNLIKDIDVKFKSMSFSRADSTLSQLSNDALKILNYNIEPIEADESKSDEEPKLDEDAIINNIKPLRKIPSVEEQTLSYLESINVYPSVNIESIMSTTTKEEKVDILSTTISYESNYEGLENLMYKIYTNSKYMTIDSIDVNSNDEGSITGNLVLTMNGLPEIDNIFENNYSNSFATNSKRVNNGDAYLPFDSFITPKEEVTVNEEEIGKYIEIFTFDDLRKYFFVPSNEFVSGTLKTSGISVSGSSAMLDYRFETRSNDNVANIVFGGKPLIIDDNIGAIDSLIMSVKSDYRNIETFGVILIDKFSQVYDVKFSLKHDSLSIEDYKHYDGWYTAEAEVPSNIVYPFRIQRIYTKPDNDKSQLNGKVYFDSLRTLQKY